MSLDNVKLFLIETIDEAYAFRQWLGERRPLNALAFDTETTGLDRYNDRIRLAQIGDGETGWAIPWDRWNGVFRDAVRLWNGDWIAHNSTFDLGFLDREDIEIPRHRVHDTMVRSRINEPHMSMALKSQCARHVDAAAAGLQEVLKGTSWTWDSVPVDYGPYWQYGALDPVLTYRLEEHHRPITDAEAPRAYELEMAVLWVIQRMERNGAHVDRPSAREHMVRFFDYCRTVEEWTEREYGVKAGSNQAIIRILEEAGYSFTKATASGAKALDAEVLGEVDHPLARAVLNRRQLQKMATTYLRFYVENADGDDLLHPSINTLGARTSRMSMDSPNLQNLPRRGTSRAGDVVRSMITSRYVDRDLADELWNPLEHGSLVMCDFSQIEMRLLAHFSGEAAMQAAFRSDEDFFVNLARQIFQDDTITKKDPRRQITKNCVPLSTQILTRRGWLKHDEVVVGDETLGFDPETRTSRWTKVTAVHHYGDAEVFRFGNKQRSFETTAEHRWITEHERTGALRFLTSQEQLGSGHRVILAAEAESGDAQVTEQEAAILGWVLSDGDITRSEFTGSPAQAGGRRVKCTLSIGQKKPHRIIEIDELLSEVPHKRYEKNGSVSWNIASDWGRSLLDRVGIWDKYTFDPWQVALTLTDAQRRALIETLNAGDGGSFKHDAIMITQANDSPVAELVVALGYLTGHFSRVYEREPSGEGWMRNTAAIINYQKPYLTGQRTTLTPVARQDVWCVTTELGTWTARQDRTPFITGNSGYAKIYGAGVRKFALTAGIPESQAREFLARFDSLYPGVRDFQNRTLNDAMARLAEEGVAYTRSPFTNRRYVAEARKEYALTNYLIQGSAAELLKRKLLELDASGLGPWMFAPVHDEVLLDVPAEHVLDAVRTLQRVMNDDTLLSVPIEAEVSYGRRWGAKRDWDLAL